VNENDDTSDVGATVFTVWERIFVLNCYGTALVGAGLLLPVSPAALHISHRIPSSIVATTIAGLSLALVGWGTAVSLRYPRRVRLARALIARIRRHGFRRDYFESTCRELCMRRVTWLVLRRVGAANEFRGLLQLYGRRRGAYIEHSNPEMENLISAGLLTKAQIAEAIAIGLGRQ
jgi:hypothetical protein